MSRKISQKRPRSNLLWYRGRLRRRDGVVLIRWTDTRYGIELLEARDAGENRLHYVTPDGGYFTDEESAVARCRQIESGDAARSSCVYVASLSLSQPDCHSPKSPDSQSADY